MHISMSVVSAENMVSPPPSQHVLLCAFLCARVLMTRRSDRYCKDKPPSLEDQPTAGAENHAL